MVRVRNNSESDIQIEAEGGTKIHLDAGQETEFKLQSEDSTITVTHGKTSMNIEYIQPSDTVLVGFQKGSDIVYDGYNNGQGEITATIRHSKANILGLTPTNYIDDTTS